MIKETIFQKKSKSDLWKVSFRTNLLLKSFYSKTSIRHHLPINDFHIKINKYRCKINILSPIKI